MKIIILIYYLIMYKTVILLFYLYMYIYIKLVNFFIKLFNYKIIINPNIIFV